MLEGHEELNMYMTNGLASKGEYNSEKDADYWRGGIISSKSLLVPGSITSSLLSSKKDAPSSK
jgi:hypothetical protein